MREVGTPDVQDEGNIFDISQHSTLNRKLFISVEAFPVDCLRDIKQRELKFPPIVYLCVHRHD